MNFSVPGILPTLAEASIRSVSLGIAVWMLLRLLRIRRPQTASLAWSFVLCAAVAMPVLVLGKKAMLEIAPRAVAWLPSAPASVFLRPLVPVEPEVFLLPDVSTVLLAVYGFVAGIELFRLCVGLTRGLILRSAASSLKETWTEGWDVRLTDRLTVPVTFGRTILLPKDFQKWDAMKKRAVLIHEQGHVRRMDFLVQILARVHRALFWFSPFAWWLKTELVRAAEDACDDEALRHVPDRTSYAEMLIDMAGRGAMQNRMEVCMARSTTVPQRVERILKGTNVVSQISWVTRLIVIAGILPIVVLSASVQAQVQETVRPITFSWIIHTTPTQPAAPTIELLQLTPSPAIAQAAVLPQETTRTAPTQVLQNWIDQEVPDISTNEERAAFANLKTAAEQEEFIRRFWLGRDPTPGTAANEYRDEYYGRVAIAGQRYGTAGNPGHRTDRGRIFVRFGPPSEIRIYAKGDTFRRPDGGQPTQTFPFERWHYPFIEGIGNNVVLEFVDTDGAGNYRLTSDPAQPLLR